jgi:hypothetical protein
MREAAAVGKARNRVLFSPPEGPPGCDMGARFFARKIRRKIF